MNPPKRLRPALLPSAIAIVLLCVLSFSCEKNNSLVTEAQTAASLSKSIIIFPFPPLLAWGQLPNLPFPDGVAGDIPSGLVSPQGFAINGKGYLCGGMTITSFGQAEELKDLWEYDTATKAWTQKAGFPGSTPDAGSNFVIGSSAFVQVGNNNWQYSQASNTWVQKANMPGHLRSHATAFAIGQNGYAGLGFDATTGTGDQGDFYKYESALDTWVRIAPFPGTQREGAMAFVINSNGYVCSGMYVVSGNPTIYLTDLWQFNSVANVWTKKQTFPANGRAHGVGLSGLGNGFAGTGSDGSGFYKDFWKYTESSNTWSSLPNIGSARDQAGSFFIGSNIYVAGGTAGLDGLKDFWTLHL
jgi:N-acetylneuraminic acid mutarotase